MQGGDAEMGNTEDFPVDAERMKRLTNTVHDSFQDVQYKSEDDNIEFHTTVIVQRLNTMSVLSDFENVCRF